MLLAAPFEHRLKELIEEVLEEQGASQFKSIMPSTIDMNRVGRISKKKIQKSLNQVQSQNSYKELNSVINQLFMTVRTVEDQFQNMPPEDQYWYVGLLEKIVKTVNSSKSTWGFYRDKLKDQLETPQTDDSDEEEVNIRSDTESGKPWDAADRDAANAEPKSAQGSSNIPSSSNMSWKKMFSQLLANPELSKKEKVQIMKNYFPFGKGKYPNPEKAFEKWEKSKGINQSTSGERE